MFSFDQRTLEAFNALIFMSQNPPFYPTPTINNESQKDVQFSSPIKKAKRKNDGEVKELTMAKRKKVTATRKNRSKLEKTTDSQKSTETLKPLAGSIEAILGDQEKEILEETPNSTIEELGCSQTNIGASIHLENSDRSTSEEPPSTSFNTDTSLLDFDQFKPLHTSSPEPLNNIITSHCVPVGQFERVTARFTMEGSSSKYMVSADEIKRRVGAPEFLNSSALAGFLRRCKVKDSGENLRLKLKQYDIELDFCQRIGAPITNITSLSENEMHNLATDLNEITSSSFPTRTIADCIIENAKTTEERDQIVEEAEDFIEIMAILTNTIGCSQPPLTGIIEQKPVDNDEFHEAFKNYSLLTHGFGPLNYHTWVQQCSIIGQNLSSFISYKNDSTHSMQ